jgi:Ca2+-binding RTX toxin-like protein
MDVLSHPRAHASRCEGAHPTKEMGMMRRIALLAVTALTLVGVCVTPAAPSSSQDPRFGPRGPSGTGARPRPECTIDGTNGDDRLFGTHGPDVICTRGGDDRVRSRGGDDVLILGAGHDIFDAGPGDDEVFAGSGSDFGNGGGGDDRIYLLAGSDYAEDFRGVDLLVGGVGDDALCVYDANPGALSDRVLGGPGPDYAGADTNDVLRSVGTVFYGGWD